MARQGKVSGGSDTPPVFFVLTHRHPLEAHLLLCAVGQQGAELDLKLFL
jgi:hypothetical protein